MWNPKPAAAPGGRNAFSNPTEAGLATRRSPTSKPTSPFARPKIASQRSPEDSELMSQITESTAVVHRRPRERERERDELPDTSTERIVKQAMDAADSILTEDESAQPYTRFEPLMNQGEKAEESHAKSSPASGRIDAPSKQDMEPYQLTSNRPVPVTTTTGQRDAETPSTPSKSTPASRRFDALTKQGMEEYKLSSPRRYGGSSANSNDATSVNKPATQSGSSPLKSRFSSSSANSTINSNDASSVNQQAIQSGSSPLKSRFNTPPRTENVVDTRGLLSTAAAELGKSPDLTQTDASVASAGSSRRSLDLIHNDNAFHVVASIVVERFQRHGSQGVYLDAEDWKVLDSSVPPAVRESFVKAVRFRLKYNCPPSSEAHVHVLTRLCAEFNLAKEGDLNPLLRQPSSSSSSTVEAAKQTIDSIQTQGSIPHMGASLSVPHVGSRSVSGLQQVNSFQNTSESVGSFAPPMSNPKLPPTPVSPTKRPPLAPSSESDNRALRNLEEQHKRLRAREVELHENASVASVLTSPSLEQQHAATSESLARKQLLAELREASTLMAESQTPEAAEFWKNHVISLQARLRSLHNETDSEVVRPISPPRRPPTKTSPRIEHNRNVPKSTKEELLSTPNYGPPKYSTEFFHPPLENPETAPRELTQLNYVKQQSGRSSPFVDQRRSSPYLGPAPPLDQSRLKHSEGSDPAKHLSTGSGADRVDVVSPADLPAGYQFEAEIDGHRFLATVPFGGAKRGETFSCIMRDLAPSGPSVPTGAWRDRLCDCTKFGVCHPVNLNTIFCPLLSLGQIMTRLKLDAFGRPTKLGGKTWSTMWTITIFWIAMNVVIYMAFNFKWVHHLPLTIPDYVAVTALNVAGIAFTLYAVAATRAAAREIYHIREYRFYDLEDNCCATFCMPCTICQLHRHTVPYDQLDAQMCSKTGLDSDVNLDFIKTHALR